MFDAIIRWSLNNRMAVLLLYALLAGAAVAAAGRMTLDVFPEFAPPQVQIQTEAPGYAAQDVEALVTRPLEVALQGAPGIEQIRSNSSVGLSRITIVFDWGVDVYRARQIIQERLQMTQGQLIDGVAAPQLMPVTSAVSWLLKFGLVDWSGRFREHELRSLVDWEVRNRLLAQPGVASVTAIGGGVKQYQIMVDPLQLQKYGVAFNEIVAAARGSNALAPGGFVYPTSEEEYFVRANGRVQGLQDVSASLVRSQEGQPITLADLAEIRFGSEIKRGDAQIYQGPAVIGTVSKLWGADTLETTRAVEGVLRQVADTLPKDVQLIPNVFRQASFIESSIDNLQEALLHSSIIVALVLFLFLFRWRPTVVSLVAIPTSLLAGVLVLWLAGVGINALTLGGLVFAIGEVVDDAIIDVENILRRLRENRQSEAPRPALEIVYEGSREIRNAVIYATLVIVAAFMPVFFLQGIEGRIFAPLAIAYLAAIGSSLVVALTLVPVLSYYLLGRQRAPRAYHLSPLAAGLIAGYRRVLRPCLRHPGLVLVLLMLLPLAAALALLPRLGQSFLPPFHEGNIIVAATLMPGTSLEENLRVGREVERRLEELPQIETVAHRAGRSRLDEDAQPVNFSEFDITVKPGTPDTPTVMQHIRERLADIPGMAVNVSQFIAHRMSEILSGVRAQVVVKVYGPDFRVLQAKQQEILAAVRGTPGVVDLQGEPMILVPGIDIRVRRDVAAAYGLTPAEVIGQAGMALNGVPVSKVQEHDKAFDLFVRVAENARTDAGRLGELPLRTPAGTLVPLREVAELVAVQEPYVVNRDGGARRAVVQWNVEGRDLNGVVQEAQARIQRQVVLPAGYSLEFGGDYIGQQRASRNLMLSGAGALLLMFIIMTQAFRNWRLASLVMANVPLALIGGVAALWLAGETLNVSSLVGLIALFGIATRNSILLIARCQSLAQRQGDAADFCAVAEQGARERLLPILMTALTAALAVLPLMIGDPVGKELERPLALVLLGGMLSSTLLNLLVMPTAFAALARRGSLGRC
ncbi:MAG: efflux RND transporter permease subunit [Pseudomonadota bacterium]